MSAPQLNEIDEAFGTLADNVIGYVDLVGRFEGTVDGERVVVSAEEITIETPIELSLAVDDRGEVAFGCAPPIYALDTTVAPVLHSIRIRAVVDPPPPERSHG